MMRVRQKYRDLNFLQQMKAPLLWLTLRRFYAMVLSSLACLDVRAWLYLGAARATKDLWKFSSVS